MTKRPQLLLIAVIISTLIAPSLTYAKTVPVSTKNAVPISNQPDSVFANCKKIADEPADKRLHTLNIEENLSTLTLVKHTKTGTLASGSIVSYWVCPAETLAEIQIASEMSGLSSIPKIIVGIFQVLIDFINFFLKWVLKFASYLLITMIGQGKFITSDIVQQAWPFVQGLANLGFIFALLYIALATTLRLESVSTSMQKLLPRLLVSALLVNFSLVIGGLLIDASRLVMAAEIKIMGNGSLDYENFSAKLIESSNATATSLSSIKAPDGGNVSALILKMTQSVIFLGLLTAGMFIVAFNLFIRYIALLILLILSPMAYLAFALPKTSSYASEWWAMFIKWVLYGPIVLFFLIIITRIQQVDVLISDTTSDNPLFKTFFNQFIHFAIIIALFFVANSVGKKVAGAGSDAAMSFVKKNPRASVIAGASLLSGGLLGGAAAAVLTSNSAKDAYKGMKKNISAGAMDLPGVKTVAKMVTPAKRDKQGNLLPGESSIGSSIASKLTGSLNPKIQKEIQSVRALMPGGIPLPNDAKTLNSSALVPSQLKKGHVINALGNNDTERSANINIIINHGSQSQRMAIAENKEYISSLSSSQMAELQQNIQNSSIDMKDKSAMIDRVMKTVQEIG